MSTTFHFNGAVGWNRLGPFVRTGSGVRSVSIVDPATGLTPAGLTQSGVAVTQITTNAFGFFSFTTTDVPGVSIDFGLGPFDMYAKEVPALAVASSAPTDVAVAALVGTSSSTQSAMDGRFAPLALIPLGPAATGTDTSALQSFLTANAGKRVALRQGASYTISNELTVGAGTRIDMQGATITQTTSLKAIFTTSADGLAVSGGTLIGKASDYADTTATYVSSAIRATSGAKNIRLIDSTLKGFAGAAVYATSATGITVRGCTIVGVGNGGGGGTYSFVAGTSKDNAGVIFDGTTSRVWIVDNDISYACQGVLGGAGSADVHVRGNTIHDIGGQHGVYLNYTTSAEVAGNLVKNVSGGGIKVQTQTGGADSTGVTITGNTVDTAAANGIIFTAASGTLRHRDVAVTGNSIRNVSNDGIVLEYVENATCTGNIVKNARAGIRVTDFVGVTVRGNRIKTTSQDGILVQALTFASSQAVVADNEIDDPASANGAATEFGIRIAEGGGFTTTTVDVSGNRVVDALGNMRYGIYASTASQATFRYLNNYSTGATDYGFRGPATQCAGFQGNNLVGTLGRLHTAPSDLSPGDLAFVTYAAAVPAAGTWARGDRCWNTTPSASGAPGWVCVTAGSPGTWKAMAVLAP